MKKVLSLLLVTVFLQVQTWALSGGPVYSGDSAVVRGTYAGIMMGELPEGTLNAGGLTANQLGIFALGVPAEGLASGAFAFFGEGSTFYGTIVAVVDPDKLKLGGILKGQANTITFSTNTQGQTTSSLTPFGFADGSVEAKLTPRGSGVGSTSFRIRGTAFLEIAFLVGNVITPFGTAELVIDGFQQSATDTGTIDINSLIGAEG